MALLDSIHSPDDLRALQESALRPLAEEMRALIVRTVNTNGGHMASNLGVIELTIALHRAFVSPRDAIVWDVGHQCYAHKILTGRAAGFPGLRRKGGLSGFPKRAESPHDIFDTGHASTSISSALGLLQARLRTGRGAQGAESGKVVAVIGDGALTGGMAFEAMSHAGHLKLPLVVVLNDNKMSISPNIGALARYLSRLSATVRYQKVRDFIDSGLRAIPFVGEELLDFMERGKRAVKAVLFVSNLFADIGFEYVGPLDGHNIPALTRVFRQVRNLSRPVVVHVVTRKGKGFERAEEDPASFHGVAPGACRDSADTANSADAANKADAVRTASAARSADAAKRADAAPARPSFTDVFGRTLLRLARDDNRVVAITAAMSKGTGLEALRTAMPDRVFDVGIAEQHAVTFAAGLAAGGMRPVVAMYSTFLQRAADQVFHDVALQNLPVVFAVDRAGLVGDDGETHQGLFDLAMFRAMPNLTIMSPADGGELELFLERALRSDSPVLIRYPKTETPCDTGLAATQPEPGRGVFLRERPGARLLACGFGTMAAHAADASDLLAGEGRPVDVLALRYAAPLDAAWLASVMARYGVVVVVEEGMIAGGVGEGIAAIAASRLPALPVHLAGIRSIPAGQATRAQLLAETGLDVAGIAEFLRAAADSGRERPRADQAPPVAVAVPVPPEAGR